MIEIIHDTLNLSCPDVHEDATCSVAFQRTLRIPEDNESYPLPAGAGEFPLDYTERYLGRAPLEWKRRPGVFLPMYQSEAMWISFGGFMRETSYPFALKISAGEVNAVTGGPMFEGLSRLSQDYVVLPDQPWLDGICIREGVIRQFTAMPLSEGYTVEEQLTGKIESGAMRLIAYPMKRECYEELRRRELDRVADPLEGKVAAAIDQDIYEDPYGVDAWDIGHGVECTLHIANSRDYLAITGRCPPTEPVTREQYRKSGIPWFKYYNADANVLRGARRLRQFDGVQSEADSGAVGAG